MHLVMKINISIGKADDYNLPKLEPLTEDERRLVINTR